MLVGVQAKDNVKYLATLDKFIEPLRSTNLTTVIDALPALLNSIKMVHTIARYYNTTERMTNLFVKVSNQVSVSFRVGNAAGRGKLWGRGGVRYCK